jgi:hypothetical protein
MADGLSSLKVGLLEVIAVVAAGMGLKAFIADSVNGQAALGRLSHNLSMNAKEVEAWGVVAKEMGDNAEDAWNSLQTVAGGMAEAGIKGFSGFTQAARAQGIDLKNADGTFMDNEQALLAISRRMQGMNPQQAMYTANSLGLGGMANELMQGPDKLRAQLDAARSLSKVTAESTAAAQRLQARWALLEERFKGIRDLVFSKLAPVLESLANRLASWLDGIDWDGLAAKIGNVIDKITSYDWQGLINSIKAFGKQIEAVIEKFGGWKMILIVVGSLLALQLLSPLTGLIGTLLRLTPLLGGVTSSITAMGAAAVAAYAGVAALTAAAVLNVQPLGGPVRSDGTRADEPSKAMVNKASGTDRTSLWNRILHKPTAYKGDEMQAAMLLAKYIDPDNAGGEEGARHNVGAILSGHIRPGITAGASDPSFDTAQSRNAANALAAAALQSGPSGASFNSRQSRFPGGNATLFGAIEAKYGLPAGLMARMFKQESGNGAHLVSSKGALGPMQFMPGTAADLGLDKNSVMDLDASANAAGKYLAKLKIMFGGDIVQAVAAYNEGPGNLKKYGMGNLPAETQGYVDALVGASARARSTASNARTSTVDTKIENLNVYTQATDAKGIAQDLPHQLSMNSLLAQANGGVN